MTLINSTERFYYRDTYLNNFEARIIEVGNDDNGDFVKVYCQKKLWAPRNPEEEPYLIKHYHEKDASFKMEEVINEMALKVINMDTRKLYARSAGHLLSNAVNKLYLELDGCNGNNFPKSVLFEGSLLPNLSRA